MTCWSDERISYMVSLYVLGFILGTFFFVLPDKIGRRKTILCLIPLQIVGSLLTLHSRNYYLICLGFVIQGMVHIKKSVAYNFPYEITDQKSANLYINFVIQYDSLSLFIFCFMGYFVTRDMIGLVRIIDCVGIIVLLTLPFLIQESPFWLIANGKNHEAREVLNKIA